MSGSVQVKAKRSWGSGEMGIVKNASLRFNTVKYRVKWWREDYMNWGQQDGWGQMPH